MCLSSEKVDYLHLQKSLLMGKKERGLLGENELKAVSESYQNLRESIMSGDLQRVEELYEALRENPKLHDGVLNRQVFQVIPEYFLYLNGRSDASMENNLIRTGLPQVLDDLVLIRANAGFERNVLANDLSVKWFSEQYEIFGSLSSMKSSADGGGAYGLGNFVQDINQTKEYYSLESSIELYQVLYKEVENGISDDYLFKIIAMPWLEIFDNRLDVRLYFRDILFKKLPPLVDPTKVADSKNIDYRVFNELLRDKEIQNILRIFSLGDTDYDNDSEALRADFKNFLRNYGIVVY